MRPVVEYIDKNWRAGDTVLVSGGGETFAYYAQVYGLSAGEPLGDTRHQIIYYERFVRDMDTLAGNDRVWIIFAYFEKSPNYTKYLRYLGSHAKVEDTFQVGYARAYLCDLNP
jgi:hypothetical protein